MTFPYIAFSNPTNLSRLCAHLLRLSEDHIAISKFSKWLIANNVFRIWWVTPYLPTIGNWLLTSFYSSLFLD